MILSGVCITIDGTSGKRIGINIRITKQYIYINKSIVDFALMLINNFETSKMERNSQKQYIQPGLVRKKI